MRLSTSPLSTDEVRLKARLEAGQRLLVQESYDPAWRAYVNGKAVPTAIDPVGFLLLDPGPGEHDVTLRFETPVKIEWDRRSACSRG